MGWGDTEVIINYNPEELGGDEGPLIILVPTAL